MSAFKPVLTEHIGQPDCHTLSFYKSVGGYTALEKILKMNPEDVTQEAVSYTHLTLPPIYSV